MQQHGSVQSNGGLGSVLKVCWPKEKNKMISLTHPKPIDLDRHKKPPYPSPAKPPQVKRAKAMTIAAGFQCRDGIVLCADRQMSHGTANDFGSFAHFEKKVYALQSLNIGATLCGSGNDGTLI